MSRHVQNTDSSVLERRLRPIYDWLDSGNNKKALQECEKVLKKTPNLNCAKALKALTLLRMGRESDSHLILDNLNSEKPLDEATLQAITLCYREMQASEKICKLYETALKLDPTNEELHTHLFMSYVRIGDFKAQQQSAMALYKQKPKNPYYCWNVMSIVLQATRGEGRTDPAKRKLLLSLGERMMKKLVDDNKVDAEQEVQLYILVLELLEKYENIIEILEGPLGEKLQCTNGVHLKLVYFVKLKKWHQVNVSCKTILSESFDRWDVWREYVRSVFELADVTVNGDSLNTFVNDLDSVDNTAEKCHEFICGIIEGGADNTEKICKLYETALKLDPTNEELHTHLFMSYVRIGDFKAQQQSAMALYKQKPKNPYYCWNVMSIVLQATRGEGRTDPAKRKLLLSLGERMMKKLVDDNKVDAEQEVQLYILVLELLEKYENIIEILEGPLGEKLQCTNGVHLKLVYFVKLKKWHQVNVSCKTILSESFDRWDVWREYVRSVFELADVTVNGDSLNTFVNDLDSVDNTAEKCHEFICGIIEGGADNTEKICKLYETALKLDPTNEELHTHLFMSYVRIGDFKAQQQSAMALYKQKPKNPYYCWNVMSIVLQATRGEGRTDPAKRKLLLSLGERMMKKLVDDNKVDAEQEVQLYILVLELLEKYENIIEILEGPLGEKLQCTNGVHLKLVYFVKLKKWHQVNVSCKTILSESFDRWDVWREYVRSVFELADVTVNGDSLNTFVNDLDSVDNTAEKCHEFICGIIEGGADNSFLLRGPYLARFELCAKLQEKNINSSDILGDTIELFIEYFRKFGHKPCCVSDLKVYLKLLDTEQKGELGTKLVKEVGIGPTSVPQSADQMQRHIGALQLSRLCGSHRNLSPEHLRALVTALTLHYQHGFQSYGKGLPSTDLGPSDNYAVLAAHILYDLSRLENKVDYLIAAIALLESVLKNSPSNFHVKLLAIKFYHILGDGMDANNIFYTLDIKHLQLDSLGYIHCGRLATTGLFSLCAIHFDTALKFFSSNYRDSADHITFSYKFGSFSKIDEFIDFREKMNNSMHYTTVVVDRIILTLVDCSRIDSLYSLDISPRDNKIEWDKLRDNKDLAVYVTYDPEFASKSVEQSQDIKRLYSQDLKFLKLRTYILWSLSAAIEVLKSLDGTRQKHVESLKQILKDWKEYEDEVKKSDLRPISEDTIAYPPPSRLHGLLETPYYSTLSTLLEFFLSLSNDNVEEAEIMCKKVEKEVGTLTYRLEQKITSASDFREKRKGMELLVNNLEVVCVGCILCIMCSELIRPPPQAKKGKKKQPPETKSKDYLTLIVNQLKTQINKLSELLTKWSNSVIEKDMVNILDSLNLNTDSSSLYQNIIHSYSVSCKEIQGVLKNKLKMLNSL